MKLNFKNLVTGFILSLSFIANAENVANWDAVASGTSLPDQGEVVSLSAYGNSIYVGSINGHVYSSVKNAGGEWSQVGGNSIPIPSDPNLQSINSLVVSGNTLYAGTKSGYVYSLINSGTSTETWTKVGQGYNGGLFGGVVSVAVSGDTVYAASNYGGVYSSKNNGDWTPVGNSGTLPAPCSKNTLVVSGSTIYIGLINSYVYSYSLTNSGDWVPIGGGSLPNDSTGVVSLGIFGQNIYAASNSGVYSSVNGKKWTNVGNVNFMTGANVSLVINNKTGAVFAEENDGSVSILGNLSSKWYMYLNSYVTPLFPSGTNVLTAMSITSNGQIIVGSSGGQVWSAGKLNL